MKIKKQEIASQENEWTTESVWYQGGAYYTGVRNGGYRGGYQPSDQINGNWGFWHSGPTEISRQEAIAIAVKLGKDEPELPS